MGVRRQTGDPDVDRTGKTDGRTAQTRMVIMMQSEYDASFARRSIIHCELVHTIQILSSSRARQSFDSFDLCSTSLAIFPIPTSVSCSSPTPIRHPFPTFHLPRPQPYPSYSISTTSPTFPSPPQSSLCPLLLLRRPLDSWVVCCVGQVARQR